MTKGAFVFRLLFLPIMATFLFLGMLVMWFKLVRQWFKYGGEFIAYHKAHDTTIATHIEKINELLNKP